MTGNLREILLRFTLRSRNLREKYNKIYEGGKQRRNSSKCNVVTCRCRQTGKASEHALMWSTVTYLNVLKFTCGHQLRISKLTLSLLIIVERDATQSSLFIILQVHSTCFGCQPHPSSGVHRTVTIASGTGHIFVQLPPSSVTKAAWPRWKEVAAQ